MGAVFSLLHELEIAQHGDEWLATVTDQKQGDDDHQLHWKPLDAWVAEFEPPPPPPPPPSEPSKLRQEIRRRAEHVILEQVDHGLATRLLRLILDVSSRILTLAESHVAEGSSAQELPLPTARILNEINGIVLSYRFQHSQGHKEYKFEFLRRRATDALSATLWTCLPAVDENNDTDSVSCVDRVLQIQQHIQQTVLYLQTQVRPILLEHLETLLARVNERIDQRIQENTQVASVAFEERLLQLDKVANEATVAAEEAVVAASETVAAVTDEAAVLASAAASNLEVLQSEEQALEETVSTTTSATFERALTGEKDLIEKEAAVLSAVHDEAVVVEQEVVAVEDAVLQKKTQVLTNFGELIRTLLIHKTDQLTAHIVEFVNRLLLAFYETRAAAVRVVETKKTNTSLAELQAKLYDRVEQMAVLLKGQVEDEVRLVTETIEALMEHKHEGEDKEVERLECMPAVGMPTLDE